MYPGATIDARGGLAAAAAVSADFAGSAPDADADDSAGAGAVSASRLSLLVGVFVAIALLLGWAGVAAHLYLKHGEAVDTELRQNTNLARALEEQTLRVLAITDHATIRMGDAFAAGAGAAAPDQMARFANETGLAPKILAQLSYVDGNGRFVGSNLDPDGSKSGHPDLSEREHVRVHLRPATASGSQGLVSADGLFIGKPVLGKVSKRWTIQVSRKIAAADGTPLGVVVASLDPSYFDEVYRRVSLGTQGGVTLVGQDRTVRARVMGGKPVGMGSSISATSPVTRDDAAADGNYRGASGVDGIDRLIAWRRVANYPLFVLVSTGAEEALADWRATRNTLTLMTVLLSLAVVTAAAALVVGLKRLERKNEALRLSEAQAQAANQAKTEFLAAISHELRTPLTSIRGFAELMEQRVAEPKFRETAGLIRKGAEYLNTLLTEILDLAKAEAGAIELAPEPLELRPLLDGVIDFFALTAEAKGLALVVQVVGDVPERLHCDGLRLKQILNNLLSNAIKFTEQGEVRLKVEVAGRELRFHVIDTGPGIPSGKQDLIFEKFRQGNSRVSHQHGGTGLGLALARALAELMRGRLGVSSEPGRGATFTLALPIQDAEGAVSA
ncbi:MAG: two-component sensor histidine kinase [Rubrivivax sp.]|nr:two-component sensor histidine kinase [Rubrivivax sp.]